MFIDTHIHLGQVNRFYSWDLSVRRLLEKMDSLNISISINSHHEGLIHGNPEKGILESIKAYEESGGRILSYHVFDPNCSVLSLTLMEKYNDRRIFKGIKIHPSVHGVYADDSRYEPVWEYAAGRGLPLMSHTWALSSYNDTQKYSYPSRFRSYIESYPQVAFICGHSGGRYDGIVEAAGMASLFDNMYLDIAGDVYNYGLVEYLTEVAGSGKVLFASDAVWFDQATQLGMVLGADISENDRENILFRNAVRVFGIEGCDGTS